MFSSLFFFDDRAMSEKLLLQVANINTQVFISLFKSAFFHSMRFRYIFGDGGSILAMAELFCDVN